MRCPECAEAGEKSTVYDRGGTSTCLYSAPYYDEDGAYHHHDPNHYGGHYECSKGHVFTRTIRTQCPTCGDWDAPNAEEALEASDE